MDKVLQWFPAEGVKILLVLFLSFLVGLEREEHAKPGENYSFGGVRTFPLIGLIGYAMALLGRGEVLPIALGFGVVGAFLWLSYKHKLSVSGMPGATTEASALLTYLVGGLVYAGDFWIATAITVASMFLLELKVRLEGLSQKIPAAEILTFTKFLLLTAVILPVLPNQAFTSFQINPFKIWLVVVAVSAISYGSYVLLSVKDASVLISGLLGGLYSSTITTVALAKMSKEESRDHMFTGAIVLASGVMYLRILLLVAIFNRQLAAALVAPFLALSALALVVGWLWSRRADEKSTSNFDLRPKNPLELGSALLFAGLFLGISVVTRLAAERLGNGGVLGLASIMGVSDVDPFILGMTQTMAAHISLTTAAAAIVVAVTSNNIIKGIYAYIFGSRETGRMALGLLGGLAIVGLSPLLWLYGAW